MSATWNTLRQALTEAAGKEQLINYISRVYGENEADELGPYLDSVWNPQQLPQVARELGNHYGDPQVGEILRKAMAAMGVNSQGEPAVKRGRGRPPGTGKNQIAQAGGTQPAPKKGSAPLPQQPGPEQPWIGATRPDRSGAPTPEVPKHGKAYVPGEKPQHDVKGPGQWQSLSSDQPSQQQRPSTMNKELEPLRSRERQLQKQVAGLKAQPGQKMAADKLELELNKVQQQIARITKAGSSSIEDAQKRVDALNSEYPSTRPGDAIARQLGVPSTKDRTRKVKYRDPQTGEEKEKLVVQIWNADKVFKFMDQASQGGSLKTPSELPPGVYDQVPGMQGSDPEKQGPWQGSGTNLPIRQDSPGGRAANQVHKPMMKAPKGLDATGLQQLSQLRQQFASAKKANDADGMARAKAEIDKVMAAGGEVVDTVRPGTAIGQRWRPSGVGVKTKTSRPDQATGNYIRGTRFTNPAEEGQEVVWDGTDWVLPSVFASSKGEKSGKAG
jgi:hypothetical protein